MIIVIVVVIATVIITVIVIVVNLVIVVFIVVVIVVVIIVVIVIIVLIVVVVVVVVVIVIVYVTYFVFYQSARDEIPIGVEDGRVPKKAMKASSMYNLQHGPQRGRLNIRNSGGTGAWCARYNNRRQFLQVC